MERAKTNGPIRGISRRSVRSVRSVRPETEEAPGTAGTVGTMGREAGAAVAPGGSGKRKTSGLVAGRFGEFAVIERLLAEREALEPIHSRNIIKMQIIDNQILFEVHSKSKSF